jgi:hypothetical protein
VNVSLVGRLYRRIQKKIFSPSTLKTAVLSFALFATFFSGVLPVFAQDATYKNYRELFKGNSSFTSMPATTDLLDTTAKKQIGLRFKFFYSFEGKTNPTNGQPQDIGWFWDHVSNDESDGFIVRVCETDASGASNESTCKITSAPYRTYPPGGTLNVIADILSIFNPLAGPSSSNIQEKKTNWNKFKNAIIFKHGYTGNASDNDTYPVRSQEIAFAIKELSTINANGSENESAISYDLKGQILNAELWYCGGEPSVSSNTDPKPYTAHTTDTTAKQFGNRCSGRSYFKIGETRILIQRSFINAQQDAQNAPQVTLQNPLVYNPDPLPTCSFGFFEEMNLIGCIARAVYYVVYWPMATLAGLLGNVFDFFLGYSIADESYRADFIVRGWRLVRDISNIFFILILVYTGFMAVFNTASVSMKKVVPNLIINALIINFSLFATHVVIDMSNITARIFYNVMPVCKGECEKDENGNITNPNRSTSGYWPLSEKIVSSFNPQKIFSSSVLNNNAGGAKTETSGVSSTAINQTIQASSKADTSSADYAGYFIIVSLVAGAIMFGTAMMFWKTAFFFLGRVVGLYITMIFAPFAFLTRGGMPLVGNIAGLKWNDWLSELVKYALLAPIFMFFLYIIYAFLNSNFLEVSVQNIDTSNFFGTVIKIVIPMLIIYFLIKYGVDLAKTYAGKVGTIVQQQTTKWAGYAGGAAMGAVGVVGSRVIGGAAAILDESRVGRGIRNLQVKGGVLKPIGRIAQETLNKARTGSFDVRQTKLGNSLFKEMEVPTDHKAMDALKLVGLPGLSVKERAGGFDAAVEKRKKAQLEEEKLLKEKTPDDKIKKKNKQEKDKYTEKVDKIIEDKLVTMLGSAAAVAALKANDKAAYEDKKIEALKDANVQAQIKNVPEPKVMKSASEMDAERRKLYAENLKEGSLLDQILNIPIVGDLTGATTRLRGDKKAAKDIEDKSKVEKELGEIEETLRKGFQDLIAVEMFQTSQSFTGLSDPERVELLKEGVISSGSNKGKRMYDILDPNEKAAVDARRKILTKDEEEEYLNLVQTREQTKFDMKSLNKEVKDAKDAWHNSKGDPAEFKKYKEKLREKWQAEKQNKIYRNFAEYVKSQKDKLKDKEPDK